MRCLTTIPLLLFLSVSAYAQLVHMPDPNLRSAVRAELKLPADTAITQEDMRRLKHLSAYRSDIINLSGLESAKHLEGLILGGNPISDLRPLAGSTHLRHLVMPNCQISDINPLSGLEELVELNLRENPISNLSPLAGLTELKSLDLGRCLIVDVSSLSHLIRLEVLQLNHNQIVDVGALANLTSLYKLEIQGNFITDHTPLDSLTLDIFVYDQICNLPPVPLTPRIKERDYPSIFTRWGSPNTNRPELSWIENIALHDLNFDGPQFGLALKETGAEFNLMGDLDTAIDRRNQHLTINPKMVFLLDIRMREDWDNTQPENWAYWVKDENNEPVSNYPGTYLLDFTDPHVQDRIVQQAIAVSQCGLYDGIMFDYWTDKWPVLFGSDGTIYRGLDAERRARNAIVTRIRAATRPNFLIMGNNNRSPLPLTASYINGGFMETVTPADKNSKHIENALEEARSTLLWLEQNLREPHINGVEGLSIPSEPPDSPTNRRWMRVFTTLSLTHSDGYVTFLDTSYTGHHWYDFWDADLGRPVGEKGQLYENREGLFIREFTNGWAVFNRSDEAQVITLPEEVEGVASGLVNTEHTLPNLDGEMYLRVKPANLADVNGDGVVNILDLVVVARGFGTDDANVDINGDGVVNVFDLVQVAGAIGGGGAAPSAYSPELSNISVADVEKWLALAQGLDIGDANLQRGIHFLEGLLAALTPKETTLLPNYPNPFNPETWIPYRLAREAEVVITIYDTKGTLVRRLALGNQPAGYYAERGKAAYWDGRNDRGEAVASGIYIYQFRAGDYAASRRMVIVK